MSNYKISQSIKLSFQKIWNLSGNASIRNRLITGVFRFWNINEKEEEQESYQIKRKKIVRLIYLVIWWLFLKRSSRRLKAQYRTKTKIN